MRLKKLTGDCNGPRETLGPGLALGLQIHGDVVRKAILNRMSGILEMFIGI
jgi:hypothetical protein